MRKEIQIDLLPEHGEDRERILRAISSHLGVQVSDIKGYKILRKSLDARKKPIHYKVLLEAFVQEEPQQDTFEFDYKNVSNQPEVCIIGAGPAGLFAALRFLELGLKPVIFERGKDVKERRRDLANITRHNTVNPDSNYCFGEGGAGTYSDGKLYTRSSKRGDVGRILRQLVLHGADPSILYDAHPHIGTNKLPGIITRIRETILNLGGELHFNSRLTDIEVQGNAIGGIRINGDFRKTDKLVLATGHSARDVFELLQHRGIKIEAKPFALGVRIEHPQALIDQIQYKCDSRGEFLPAASYSLVHQVEGRGVFSFCMCPGGIIAPAMTAPGEIVVNGWSPSKRNNPYANSGMVTSIEQKDFKPFAPFGELAGMAFQRSVEQTCFEAAERDLKAPAQRMGDFIAGKASSTLPENSYLPGTVSRNLNEILPSFVAKRLREGLAAFGKKMKGYHTNEAIVLATESRTSSPVRIPRDKETFMHVEVRGLFPCAEGAGYAGGIVSAAMDGENVANALSKVFYE
ncbi:MAG: FAD-binding protein [Bacteroidia bacterium]|nr:FAD-binding protein [Bacteroidia bacterium]